MFEDEGLVDRVAEHVRRRGWQEPAVTVLELGRPLALVASQMLWLAQPALGVLMARETIAAAARVLEHPDGVDLLIARLQKPVEA
ncbi:MAG: hypothetical protein R3300_15565 [Candidatus Promineifilaceae bacterium]|nr:hypothetical protein [Candidatus Promineifilaceae bacterium]